MARSHIQPSVLQTSRSRHLRIGEILVESGLLTREQVNHALEVQQESHQHIGHVLASLGFLSDDQVVAAVLAHQFNLPLVDLSKHAIDMEAITRVPKSLATRHTVFPLKLEENVLTIVMANPSNIQADEAIMEETGLRHIQLAVASETQILEFLARNYPEGQEEAYELLEQAVPTIAGEVITLEDAEVNPKDLLKASGFDSVIRAVNSILWDAVKRGASDIHLEPYEQAARVRYRLDGRLRLITHLPLQAYPAVVSRLKVMSNLDISENRRPQDGSFKAQIGAQAVNFRLSTLRTSFGEKVVVRILDTSMRSAGLQGLGLHPRDLERFQTLLQQPQGLLLVTGPTGSGKTTTLYSGLNALDSDEMNIVTVEDPIEYQLKGINQVQVDEKAHFSFAQALRSILRQDPNVIMIGEIRDTETAQIAIRASLTGHLVMATIHTLDACSTPARLMDMGIEPYLIGASLIGVVAQRLVRRLCPQCSQSERKPVGCVLCGFTGYAGRMGIYELLTVDNEVRRAISHGSNATEILQATQAQGFRSLLQDADEKVGQGLTTEEQIVAVIGNTGANAKKSLALPADGLPFGEVKLPNGGENALKTGPRPVIRLQIEAQQIRLLAATNTEILAANTYNLGMEKWHKNISAELGISKSNLLTLLKNLPLDGSSPFDEPVKQAVGPLIRAVQSIRKLFPPESQEAVVVKVRWDKSQFPILLETFRSFDPDQDYEPLDPD
jgi:type IV pilus assembly protein PilB